MQNNTKLYSVDGNAAKSFATLKYKVMYEYLSKLHSNSIPSLILILLYYITLYVHRTDG